MTLRWWQQHMAAKLCALYDEPESESLARNVLMHCTGYDLLHLHLHCDSEALATHESCLNKMLNRLMQAEPLQYVLGYTLFCDLNIQVNKSVLIPRPETEEMVQTIIAEQAHRPGLRILDMCTGSGCIALSLAKHLNTSCVTAIDVSPEALQTAAENAVANGVRVNWVQADVLEPLPELEGGPFDVIVSNPPYVLQSEAARMHRNVLEFEPHRALFVHDNNSLCFYEAILNHAVGQSSNQFSLYLEINESKGSEMAALIQKYGFSDVSFYNDINKKCRFVKVTNMPQK